MRRTELSREPELGIILIELGAAHFKELLKTRDSAADNTHTDEAMMIQNENAVNFSKLNLNSYYDRSRI